MSSGVRSAGSLSSRVTGSGVRGMRSIDFSASGDLNQYLEKFQREYGHTKRAVAEDEGSSRGILFIELGDAAKASHA